MKRITKIRIPKGKYCGKNGKLCPFCIYDSSGLYNCEFELFKRPIDDDNYNKCIECLTMYPNGAVFELKENK